MIRKIKLMGALGNKYGKELHFDVSSVAEVIRALASQFPDFLDDLRKGSYKITHGETFIGEDRIHFGLGNAQEIQIIPVVGGAKSEGVGKVILGVAIVALAFIAAPAAAGLGGTAFTIGGGTVTYGTIALVGTSIALSGVSMMLTPLPKIGDYGSREQADQRPSFLFNGAVNSTEQGAAIPIVYGKIRTGSVVVSTGLVAEDVSSGG